MRCANQAAELGKASDHLLSRSGLVYGLLLLGHSLGRSLGTFGFNHLLVVLLGPARARIPFRGVRLSGGKATSHNTTQHGLRSCARNKVAERPRGTTRSPLQYDSETSHVSGCVREEATDLHRLGLARSSRDLCRIGWIGLRMEYVYGGRIL